MAQKMMVDPLLQKLAKFNFLFVVGFALHTIIFDGGNVLTRQGVYHRWLFFALLLAVYTAYWAACKKATKSYQIFRVLLLCVTAELVLAGFITYWERGMASTSTILYALPIASMALWRSRTYTIGVSILASATYALAATKYFYDFFNEGYRVQLYGEIFFYAVIFIVVGSIIASLAHVAAKK